MPLAIFSLLSEQAACLPGALSQCCLPGPCWIGVPMLSAMQPHYDWMSLPYTGKSGEQMLMPRTGAQECLHIQLIQGQAAAHNTGICTCLTRKEAAMLL